MFHVIFHRIHIEQWHAALKSIGCVIFLTVFVLMFLRALLMPRKTVDHASSLPLADEKAIESHEHYK